MPLSGTYPEPGAESAVHTRPTVAEIVDACHKQASALNERLTDLRDRLGLILWDQADVPAMPESPFAAMPDGCPNLLSEVAQLLERLQALTRGVVYITGAAAL